MAIKKSDVVAKLTAKQEKEVTAFEEVIIKKLEEEWVPGKSVHIDIPHGFSDRSLLEIIKRYTDPTMDWNVKHTSGQTDGNFLTFS